MTVAALDSTESGLGLILVGPVARRARACVTKLSGVGPDAGGVSRFQLPTDAQWSLIEDLHAARTGLRGRPFQDARSMVEGIIYPVPVRIAWRDVPEVFGPWPSIWTWHRRMSADGTWDAVLPLMRPGRSIGR